MSNLIVIRIVPQSPLDAATFTNYLGSLGGLQITAFDLSFNSPTVGQDVGSAIYVTPTTLPSPSVPYDPSGPPPPPPIPPDYGSTGIAQQVDLIPDRLDPNNPLLRDSAFYQFEAVATAVIEIPSPPAGQTTRATVRPLPSQRC